MIGLQWHYDVTGAEPIIRDVRVYNSGALLRGTAMSSGAIATSSGLNCGDAIVATGNVLSNIVGVLQQDVTAANALSVPATGVDFYAKCIINPFAVWLTKYSTHADDDSANTAASATGVTLTATMVTNHYRSWAYVTSTGSSTGGFGNLFQVGAMTTTTLITATSGYTSGLVGNTTSDTFIVLPAQFTADVAGGSVDLSDASGQKAMQLAGYNADAAAGAAVILENYIQSTSRALEPLVNARHSGRNFKGENPDFYGDVMFSEHLLADGGGVCTRVIT